MNSALRALRFVPTEPVPISNARLVAELQALTLALRIGGLDGLRSGAVQTGERRE